MQPNHSTRTQVQIQHTTIETQPRALYESAINQLLTSYYNEPWEQDIIKLLRYVDHKYERLSNLFVELLQSRDMWIPYVGINTHQSTIRRALENNLVLRRQQLVDYAPFFFFWISQPSLYCFCAAGI